jgi:general secretion pathway protein K
VIGRALSNRRGYALLAVLWVCAGVATLGIGVSTVAREAIGSSRNRVALTEAEWLARGCVARARATLRLELQAERAPAYERAAVLWLHLDSLLPRSSSTYIGNCTISVRPVGARLDVNGAPEELLARLFRQAGVPAPAADSAAAALADWKDGDDVPRPSGAERDWYAARRMVPPGNRPFADRSEIALVRGAAAVPWERLLDVEPGAISLSHAAEEILAILPGFSQEAVKRVVEMRRGNQPPRAFLDIASGVTTEAGNAVMAALPELAAIVSLEPRGWLVEFEAQSGKPAVRVVVETRLEKAGVRVRVARERTWSR